MAREDLHFRLRIPEDLKARVEQSARMNGRSMTAEIVSVLKEAFPEIGFRSVPIGDILEMARVLQPKGPAVSDETIATLWEICTDDAPDVPLKIRDAVRAKAAELGLRQRFGLK